MTDETLERLKEKILSNCGDDIRDLVDDYLSNEESRVIVTNPQLALTAASLDAVLNLVVSGKLMLVQRDEK